MTPADDRAEFEAMKLEQGGAMAADADLHERAQQLAIDADRYQWSYQWTWLGLPIIQMPPDILALQEVIWATRPQVVVETGVARGGSVVFSASILELLGEGSVVAVDIDIRAHNRAAIEEHPLADRIRLVQGSSIDPSVVDAVRDHVGGATRVMVVLDSNHTHEHVLAELAAYAPMVTEGQYLVVADTAIEDIPVQSHRPRPWGPGDSPKSALAAYLDGPDGRRFVLDHELEAKLLMSSNPGGYLRCVASA